MSDADHRDRRARHAMTRSWRRGRCGVVPDAALVVAATARSRWVGRGRRRARRRRARRRRRPGGAARLRRLARAPGVRRRPLGGVRGPDDRRRRTTAAASPPPSPPPAPPRDEQLRAQLAAAGRGDARPGHDDGGGQERVRADRRPTRRAPCGWPREVTAGDDLPRRARRARRVRRDRDDYVELVTGPMLAACAPYARWIDVFCEPASPHAFDGDEARAVLEAGRAAGLRPAGARQPARARAGRAAGRRAGRGQRRPLHLPRPTPTSTRWPAGRTPWRRCCPASSSPPARPTRTPAGCSMPASPSRWPPTATRARCYSSVDAVLHRAGGAGDGHDPRRGAAGGHRGRRRGAAPRPTSATSRSAPAPTWPCSTRRPTCTWPTGRACRSPALSS